MRALVRPILGRPGAVLLPLLLVLSLSGCAELGFDTVESPAPETVATARPPARPSSARPFRPAVPQPVSAKPAIPLAPSCPAPDQGEASEPDSDLTSGSAPASGWFNLKAQGLSSWQDLALPLRRSLAFLESRPREATAVRRGPVRLSWGQLAQSARDLLELLPRLDAEPGLMAERFSWLALAPDPLLTSYFTPEIPASLTRRPGYEHPLYGPPPELAEAETTDIPALPAWPGGPAGEGTLDRRAVDVRRTLAGRGLEIAWARSALDVFYVQLEGAGLLRLPDGHTRTAQFAASNGQRFRPLGDILCERGLLSPDRRGKREVRRLFRERPEEMRELMSENRRYVFFRLLDGPPQGALGKPLTPLVSLATDPSLLPLGSVLILDAEIPAPSGKGTRHIKGPALAQDTGAAIRGAHLDLYMGAGNAVEDAADRVRTRAGLYLLISKNALGHP